MIDKSCKIYSGKRCEEYYKKYTLVSAVHKIIDLEDIIKEVREYIEYNSYDFGTDIFTNANGILQILYKEVIKGEDD